MFSEELEKIDWEKITKAIYSKTEHDVLRALGKEHCDVDDFMALISPAAAKYLEPMAQLSKRYTEERFGKTSFHVYTAVYNKLLHQFLRVLWFSYQQPDGSYHPHPRTD
jgi:tyrosine lyase ThiH